MVMVEVRGRIDEAGRLEIDDLPEGLPPGEVVVRIEPVGEADEDRPWTDDEMEEFFHFEGCTGTEIVASGLTGVWKDIGITDGQAWVEEKRRQRKERRHRAW